MIQTLSWADVAKVVRPDRQVGRTTVNTWVRRGVKANGQTVYLECWRGPNNVYIFTADQVARFLAALQTARRGVSVSPAAIAAEIGCSAVPVGAEAPTAGVPAGVLGPGGRMYPPLTRRGQRAPAAVVAGMQGGRGGRRAGRKAVRRG
ncbi:MAG: hypothetical protein IOD15_09180 [Phycisphaerales bacterium]|nr:hypothetical protein [Phycisphaerales bacterium]